MKCNKCDTENPDSNNFCSNCGVKLEEAKCQNCGEALDTNSKFCGKCGENNPFFKEEIERKTDKRLPNNRKSLKEILVKQDKLIRLILIVFVSLFTFGISFAATSTTTFYQWVETDGEYELIDFSVRQNAFRYYQAYFEVIGIEDESDLDNYYEEFYEQAVEAEESYGTFDEMTSRDFSKAFSKLNLTGLIMVDDLDLDHPFTSTIEYFIVLILLFILQLLPLVILTLAVHAYLTDKHIFDVHKLFLIAGIIGIVLAFFLPNMVNKSRAGGGLLTYIIFMIVAFLIMEVLRLIKKKRLFYGETYKNTIDLVLVTILLILIFGSFIRIGYKETPTKTYWGTLGIEDTVEMVDIFNDDFEFDDSYVFSLPSFNDTDLTRSNKNTIAKVHDFQTILYLEHLDGGTGQSIFLTSIMILSLMLLVSVLILFYKLLANLSFRDYKIIYIFKFIIVISFLGLFILSIISSVNLNKFFDDHSSSFKVSISIGLIFAIILSVLSLLLSFNKHRIFLKR